ncbi:MAG: hypothetical protein RL448_583 [Actinomycetota bacterium]
MSNKKFGRPFWTAIVVIFIWFGASGVFGPLFGSLSSVQTNDQESFLPASAESTIASREIAKFSDKNNIQLPALVLFEGDVTQEKVVAVNSWLQGISDTKIENSERTIGEFLTQGQPVMAYPAQDGKAILGSIPISLDAAGEQLENKEPVLPAIIKTVRDGVAEYSKESGWNVSVTGPGAILGDLFGAFGGIDSTLLLTTLGVVSIILILVYRSPVLWILPLLSAVFALSTAGGIIYMLAKANALTLSGQSQGILSVLVLGAATDYALLLISRYREELHHHESVVESMRVAYKGTFEPILASGLTVIAGLMVLLLSDLKGNQSLGPVGAIGIASSMVTILTLLPALLVVFGRWIFWPRIPQFDDKNAQLEGFWAKVGNLVARRPKQLAISTALILVIFAGFATTLKADGLSTTQAFTGKIDSVVGQDKLLKHFPGGQGQPTQIVVKQESADAVATAVRGIEGIAAVDYLRDGVEIPGQPQPPIKVVQDAVILNATLDFAPDSEAARKLVPTIREVAKKVDASVLVGGGSAVNYDVDVAAQHDNRTIIPIVLILIALILTVLLRSILAGAVLLATVVLSYFATIGVCQLVFEHIFKFPGADTSFPLFAFIFLVALGIDYNIFLMTRVREESIKRGTREGVIRGLTVTGGVITSAGIVLAATFAVLGVLPLVFLAELGFAVGFGVLLDTIVVRSLLVPSIVRVAGKKIWWPSKLEN